MHKINRLCKFYRWVYGAPKVINGASDLIVSVFGDAGMHTRAAVSTNSLPLGVSVEVDAIFELN